MEIKEIELDEKKSKIIKSLMDEIREIIEKKLLSLHKKIKKNDLQDILFSTYIYNSSYFLANLLMLYRPCDIKSFLDGIMNNITKIALETILEIKPQTLN